MPLCFDKIYAPLLLAGLILLMKLTPWFYDIALGGTDRIVAMILAGLFSMVKFFIRLVQSALPFREPDESVQYS